MDPIDIIQKYYSEESKVYPILLDHSELVTRRALEIARAHPELELNMKFIEEAAMLHDIGIFLTYAPGIGCYGDKPYLCHGYLGSELLQREGMSRHALVCERHTGTGLSISDIINSGYSIPRRDMIPISLEEQLICFSDKFYSKSKPGTEKTIDKVRKSLEKYGPEHLARFDHWCDLFL